MIKLVASIVLFIDWDVKEVLEIMVDDLLTVEKIVVTIALITNDSFA